MSESVTKKADRYLTEGRVVVLQLSGPSAHFQVTGSQPYEVKFSGTWSCACPARVEACAHIIACQKITAFEPIRMLSFTGDDEASRFIQDMLRGIE